MIGAPSALNSSPGANSLIISAGTCADGGGGAKGYSYFAWLSWQDLSPHIPKRTALYACTRDLWWWPIDHSYFGTGVYMKGFTHSMYISASHLISLLISLCLSITWQIGKMWACCWPWNLTVTQASIFSNKLARLRERSLHSCDNLVPPNFREASEHKGELPWQKKKNVTWPCSCMSCISSISLGKLSGSVWVWCQQSKARGTGEAQGVSKTGVE